VRWILIPLCQLWLLEASATEFSGSKSCGRCHRELYATYVKTPMGRSMSPAGDPGHLAHVTASATVFHAQFSRYFRVFRDNGQMFQSEYELDSAGKVSFQATHKLEYAVGSGLNGYSYLVRRGNYLFQAPLSFYSRAGQWGLSPGYQNADWGFSRLILPSCIGCHSGDLQPVPHREGMYRDPPFRELSVGCESCHGPGASHAAQPGKGNIVNPAKLPTRLAEDICMRCHQDGDTRVLQPGKEFRDFRPGTPLAGTLAIFMIPPKPGAASESDLLQHHFLMRQSKCHRASAGRMSCLTCHNPHQTSSGEEAVTFYRARCLSCHTVASCALAPEERQRRSPSDHCAGCHMPKRELSGVSHSALTHHRIVRYPGQPLPSGASPNQSDLVHLNPDGTPLPAVTLLRAYGEVLEKEPGYVGRYFRLLEEARREAPDDWFVLAALGRKALRESPGRAGMALEFLVKSVALKPDSATPYLDLAEAQSRLNRHAEAVESLKNGVALFPYTRELSRMLAYRYLEQKEFRLARDTLREHLVRFPEDSAARKIAAEIDAASR
jgi:cytochrome c554/c'-like protein